MTCQSPVVPYHSLGLKLGLTGNTDTQLLTLSGFEFNRQRLAQGGHSVTPIGTVLRFATTIKVSFTLEILT